MELACWGNPEAALPTRLTFPGNSKPLAAHQSGHVSGNFHTSSHKGPHPPSVTSCFLPSLLVVSCRYIRAWGCNIPMGSQMLITPNGGGFLGMGESNNAYLQCWFYH